MASTAGSLARQIRLAEELFPEWRQPAYPHQLQKHSNSFKLLAQTAADPQNKQTQARKAASTLYRSISQLRQTHPVEMRPASPQASGVVWLAPTATAFQRLCPARACPLFLVPHPRRRGPRKTVPMAEMAHSYLEGPVLSAQGREGQIGQQGCSSQLYERLSFIHFLMVLEDRLPN